ncbi:uncharacterized protein LOC130712289 [Lotus japonicus]|uniref:uncharacterized protein LOC130712289 n=1 Tax=Lotus japonicus TaxID=34305 RepID=UPI002586CAB5|nr:uncharacterized protein LOC130712289 [Lotus japonicus]
MWRIFRRYEKVWEIYIPATRTKEGLRFGFVHFKDIKDVKYLELRLNQIVIGIEKVHVNLARYSKENNMKVVKAYHRPETEQKRETKEQGPKQHYNTGRTYNHSYAQTVKTGAQGRKRIAGKVDGERGGKWSRI